jgi:hypothetical protein
MATMLRLKFAGTIYHVLNRAGRRELTFRGSQVPAPWATHLLADAQLARWEGRRNWRGSGRLSTVMNLPRRNKLKIAICDCAKRTPLLYENN